MAHSSAVEVDQDYQTWYSSYAAMWSIGTMVTLIIQNIAITRLGAPSSVPANQFWLWRNTLISWVHAAVTGVWTLYCIAFFDDMRADPIDYVNPSLYAMVVFSTTYFVYDFMDHVLNGKVKANWEVSLHHIAVSATFIYNAYIQKCFGYTSYALLTEVNGVFLHLRRLMKLAKVDHNSPMYRINAVANLVTCFIFRGAPVPLVLSGYYFHPVIEKLGYPYFVISLFSCTTLSVIQIFLFFRLYKSDFGKSQKKKIVSTRDHENNDIKVHAN